MSFLWWSTRAPPQSRLAVLPSSPRALASLAPPRFHAALDVGLLPPSVAGAANAAVALNARILPRNHSGRWNTQQWRLATRLGQRIGVGSLNSL